MELKIELGERSYNITIESGAMDRLLEHFEALEPVGHVLVVTDETVAKHYLHRVESQLKSSNYEFSVVQVADGENSKSSADAKRIWDHLAEQLADRNSIVVALGGGVVGDLAGFVAATYARGIRLIQVPTSLLAQVDSSVGGKTGINITGGKNLVGSFWQPVWVVIDPDCLKTLDERNYRAGLAEVVKYGVIQDAEFFSSLEQNTKSIEDRDPEVLIRIIRKCCQIKADIVTQDETETKGKRAILNYGHTIGHAIEKTSGYGTLLHGEAISIGMNCEALIAESLGMIDHSVVERQQRLLQQLGLPLCGPIEDVPELIKATKVDKKSSAGKARYVLPTEIGTVKLIDNVSDQQVRTAIDQIQQLVNQAARNE